MFKLYFYLTGCVISLIIGIYEYFKYRKSGVDYSASYGEYCLMIFMSWLMVIVYAIPKIEKLYYKIKKEK